MEGGTHYIITFRFNDKFDLSVLADDCILYPDQEQVRYWGEVIIERGLRIEKGMIFALEDIQYITRKKRIITRYKTWDGEGEPYYKDGVRQVPDWICWHPRDDKYLSLRDFIDLDSDYRRSFLTDQERRDLKNAQIMRERQEEESKYDY